MTSDFGEHRLFHVPDGAGSSKTESFDRHGGVDLRARRRAPVHAPQDGTVVVAEHLVDGGLTVVIAHGQETWSVLMHLDRLEVQAGQEVARGDVVGRNGSTGSASAPHVHWALRMGGHWVDPMSVLEHRGD